MSEEQFMARQKELIEAGEYAEFLWNWGADASRSAEFKQRAFSAYTPDKHDVIVATYPKSGTTWMMQMAHLIAFNGEAEFGHQYDVIPWPDKLVPLPDNIELTDRSVVEASPNRLRVIKSHLEAEYIPYNSDAKTICVIRDPKDTLVSMSVFENGFNEMLFGAKVPLHAWVEAFQTDRFMYQPWPEFTDSWWQLRHRDNVFVITYEEMKADSIGTIKRVAEFMGVILSSDQVAQVQEKTSFTYMKKNEHLFSQPAWGEGNVQLVRSGKSGASKEVLSLEQQQQIDAFCLREFDRIGSDFPYREKFPVAVS